MQQDMSRKAEMLLQMMIFLHVPIPYKGLEKTQFDIFRYYKIAYSRDKVLLAVRSDYKRELYSSKLASFRSPLLIIIPTERLLTAAGVSVMR